MVFFQISIGDQERNLQKRQILFIFSSVYNSGILMELMSQNEATAPSNKDGPKESYHRELPSLQKVCSWISIYLNNNFIFNGIKKFKYHYT